MDKLDNIRLLRVLACLGVFIAHLAPRLGATGLCARIANFGAAGVYLFFLICGFLACRAKELTWGSAKGGVGRYYGRRLLRVLPLYYAVIFYNFLLHSFILQDVTPDPGGLYWFRYIFLTNVFLPAPDNFWGNLSATWTIGLFVFFYLSVPLWRRFSTKLSSVILLYLAALLARHIWVALGLSAYLMFLYYFHFFLLGAVVRCLWERFLAIRGALYLMMGALAVGSLQALVGLGNDYFLVCSWIFGILLLLTKGLKLREGCFKKVLLTLDKYSYSIYLAHAVVIDGIVLLQGHIALSGRAVLGLALGLTAVGSVLAHKVVEEPFLKIGAKLGPDKDRNR